MKKMIFRTVMCLSMLILISVAVKAQISQARTAMENLYKVYDSMPYITFDVKYTYSTDTLYENFTHDELTGTYSMSGKKAKFSLGDVEYMQNDTFFIAAYSKDKIVILSDARQTNGGSYMPLRNSIDSLLDAYFHHYTVNVKDSVGDSTGYIQFTMADALATFRSFKISFSKIRNCITSLEYDFYDQFVTNDSSDLATDVYPEKRLSKLRIEFLNYRFDNFSNDAYDESNYIWFEDGIVKPVAKLQGYKVYDAR